MNTAQHLRKTLRIPEVCSATGLSRTAVYDKGNKKSKYFDPTFPIRFKISLRSSGWDASSVDAWVLAQQEKALN